MRKQRKKTPPNTQFAVLGLGRFGTSIVETLASLNEHVLAVDNDEASLHDVANCATAVVKADVTDETAMAKLGLGNFDVVIIAIGEDFESSVMATMMAKEQGAKYVLVKARGRRQRAILERIGADRVVLPEFEMGARIARTLARPNVLDVLDNTDQYTIQEMRPDDSWIGKTIQESNIRKTSGQMIMAIRRGGEIIMPVIPDEVIVPDDILITLDEHEKK